jgi:hypothetical protein
MVQQIEETLANLLEGFFVSCEHGTYKESDKILVYVRTTFQKGSASLTCGIASKDTIDRLSYNHDIKASAVLTSHSDQATVINRLMEQLK